MTYSSEETYHLLVNSHTPKQNTTFIPLTILEGPILWQYEMKKCCKKYKKKGKHCKDCPKQ